MIFNNQNIDYSKKTKRELYENLFLFYVISNKHLVFIGKIILNLALYMKLPIKVLIKNTVFKYFCGGESIKESEKVITLLGEHNIKSILDFSIEGKQEQKSFENTYNEIINNLNYAHANNLVPFSVFKISGLARINFLQKINHKVYLEEFESTLSQKDLREYREIKNRLWNIAHKAKECKIPILIDAEESWIQNSIDFLTEKLMCEFNNDSVIIFNTVQLYRKDKLMYIKKLHKNSVIKKYRLGLKLVRGAYIEKEYHHAIKKKHKSPIHNTKEECDQDFNEACLYCLKHINTISICVGTHNEESTAIVTKKMLDYNIKRNDERIYFAQLLGMSDNISFTLSKNGYNTAKYVPYGPVKEVIPYLIRRAEENSSISGQTNKEILRIKEAIMNY